VLFYDLLDQNGNCLFSSQDLSSTMLEYAAMPGKSIVNFTIYVSTGSIKNGTYVGNINTLRVRLYYQIKQPGSLLRYLISGEKRNLVGGITVSQSNSLGITLNNYNGSGSNNQNNNNNNKNGLGQNSASILIINLFSLIMIGLIILC